MNQLNPTLVDGLWPWRRRLTDAAMILSTLVPRETVTAATELARELAGEDRVVVLTGAGASEPLFWHVPAGKELDTVEPDLVLLLIHKQYAASTRLMLATASRVILITGSGPEDRAESLRLMQMIVERSSPSHIEVVVVADRRNTAREAGGDLVSLANGHFSNRTSWRHLSARRVREVGQEKEEGPMASMRPRLVPLSEAELRARDWEESFRRAERLLHEAQDALRRQLGRNAGIGENAAMSAPAAPRHDAKENRAQAV